MKSAKIKLFCLSMLAILTSMASTNANDYEPLVYNESSEMSSEVVYVNHLDSEWLYNADVKTVATSLFYGDCTKRILVWKWGWFPRLVWKTVSVDCPQAAPSFRGPGTTIPPH